MFMQILRSDSVVLRINEEVRLINSFIIPIMPSCPKRKWKKYQNALGQIQLEQHHI